MTQLDDIARWMEVVDNCACCRPVASLTMNAAADLIERAITIARERQLPKLLFNGSQLTGFPSPSLAERYFFARRFATAAEGKVQMGLVLPREMIDPEKFGILVARNAGMNADVFDNEPEALAWLLPRPRG